MAPAALAPGELTPVAPEDARYASRRPAVTTIASDATSGPADSECLDLRRCRHFVNLTNGIEALPMLDELQLPYSFVRIQSTACEQQNLEALMADLDANLLVSLALGHCCLVYDCGSRSRNGNPRALWYGLEFIRYTLSTLWLRQPCPALLRGKNVARTFDDRIRAFRQSTTRRLQYYARYLPPPTDDGLGPLPQQLRLYGVCRATDRDEDTAYFVDLLHRHQLPPPPPQPPDAAAAAASWEGPGAHPLLPPPGDQQRQRRQKEDEGWRGSHPEAPASHHPAPLASTDSGRQQSTESHCPGASCDDGGGGGGNGGEELEEPDGGIGVSSGSSGSGGDRTLSLYGFRLFRRGLSQAEWAVKAPEGPPF